MIIHKRFMVIAGVVVVILIGVGSYFLLKKEKNVFLSYGVVKIVDRYDMYEITPSTDTTRKKPPSPQEIVLVDRDTGRIKVILAGRLGAACETLVGKEILVKGRLVAIGEIKKIKYARLEVKKVVKVFK